MTIQAHPQIAAKGFVYASCHGRREARRAVTALLRSQFPLRRIHVLSEGPTGFDRIELKWRHYGALGALGGAGLGVSLSLAAWWTLSALQPLSVASPVHWGAVVSALLLGAAVPMGYRVGQRQQRLGMAFPGRATEQAEILVGLYADHRQAKATRAAFRSAHMGRTYVAHPDRRRPHGTAHRRSPNMARAARPAERQSESESNAQIT